MDGAGSDHGMILGREDLSTSRTTRVGGLEA